MDGPTAPQSDDAFDSLTVEEQRELCGECVDCGEELGTEDVMAGDSRCTHHALQDAEDFYLPPPWDAAEDL